MSKEYYNVPILKLDEVTSNQRIYTKDSIAKAIVDWKERNEKGSVSLLGTPNPEFPIDLEKVSHEVFDLRIEGDYLVGTARILDTPYGKIMQDILGEKSLEDAGMRIYSVGTGEIAEDGVVTEYKLFATGIEMIPSEKNE